MKLSTLSIFLILVFASIPTTIAQEDEGDIKFRGIELELLLSLVSAILSTVLFIITFTAYKRDERKRLLFVSVAFLLFAIRGFIISSALFIPEIEWFDPLAVILEFAIILSFFFGIVKK